MQVPHFLFALRRNWSVCSDQSRTYSGFMQTDLKNVLTLPGCKRKSTQLTPAKLVPLTQAIFYFFSHFEHDPVYDLTEMAEGNFIHAKERGDTLRIEKNAKTELRLRDLLEALHCFYVNVGGKNTSFPE